MSATLTPPSPADLDDAPAPARPPGGRSWAMLRLHRWALWVWIAYVALGAGLLLWAWGPAANEVRSLLGGCELGPGPAPACAQGLWSALNDYEELRAYAFYVIFLAPLLVGAWAAASLTARELETGTAQLAWTQSITPARWLTAKLALPAVAVAAGMTLLLALYRLAHFEGVGLRREIRKVTPAWWGEDFFTTMGVVMVPRVLCAVAVGVLLGLLLKRTLASLGTGLLLIAGSTFAFTLGRPALWPTEIRHGRENTGESPYLSHTGSEWQISTGAVTESGDMAGEAGEIAGYGCMEAGYRETRAGFDSDAFYACLKDKGYTDVWIAYHPESHYWPLQLVESGIWLALAAGAVLLSYRVLRNRTAVGRGAA